MWGRRRVLTGLVAAAGLVLTACGGSDSSGKVELSLVAYSTPQEAYEKLITAFQATPEGRNVTFTTSFGPSGDQSRAVESGLKADVVGFSLAPDINRLVKANLVSADWNKTPTNGMVTDSVVVFVVRKGNPKNIHTWADLTKPGVEVITPNPFTSGGARWNVLAAYGANSGVDKDQAVGVSYLNDLFANVPVQDDSARKSLQTFTGGKGDVLIAYENEAIFAQQKGQEIDYVVPDDTILIENPIAMTANSAHPAEAKAFVDFVLSPAGQEIFVQSGYRPVIDGVPGADKFPTPSGLFTVDDLGGWSDVNERFFNTSTGLMVEVEHNVGVTVESK